MIPEIDIRHVAILLLKRYGENALVETTARADELAAAGDAKTRAKPPFTMR